MGEVIESLLSDDNYIKDWGTGSKDTFHRIDYYKRIKFEEIFQREYGYVFEAEKCVVKQANESEYNTYKYYYMSISEPNVVMNRWKDENVRTTIRLNMSEEDLLRLKIVAESFMEASIEGYNSYDLPRHLEWLEEHPEYKED